MVESVSGFGFNPGSAGVVPSGTFSATRELLERRVADSSKLPSIPSGGEPVNRNVSFELRPEIDMIQTLVFDRDEGEVIREIPTSERLQFVEQFRRQLSKAVGGQFDIEV